MNNYPPQLPPPPPPSGGYNPFNPYQGYDPNADYIPWLPGRQGPRFLPILLIVAAILICSCCSFLAGGIIVYELDGINHASASAPDQPPEQPTDEPTPESFSWQVVIPNS